MMTIATIIASELRNEAQNFASPKSSIQFSRPMNSGGRIPRYSVKLRKTFHTRGIRMMNVKSRRPGMRKNQNPRERVPEIALIPSERRDGPVRPRGKGRSHGGSLSMGADGPAGRCGALHRCEARPAGGNVRDRVIR